MNHNNNNYHVPLLPLNTKPKLCCTLQPPLPERNQLAILCAYCKCTFVINPSPGISDKVNVLFATSNRDESGDSKPDFRLDFMPTHS